MASDITKLRGEMAIAADAMERATENWRRETMREIGRLRAALETANEKLAEAHTGWADALQRNEPQRAPQRKGGRGSPAMHVYDTGLRAELETARLLREGPCIHSVQTAGCVGCLQMAIDRQTAELETAQREWRRWEDEAYMCSSGMNRNAPRKEKGAEDRPRCTCTTPAGSEHSRGCPSYHRKGADDGE